MEIEEGTWIMMDRGADYYLWLAAGRRDGDFVECINPFHPTHETTTIYCAANTMTFPSKEATLAYARIMGREVI